MRVRVRKIVGRAYTRPKHADAAGAARLEYVGKEEVVAGAVAADDCVTSVRLYDDRAGVVTMVQLHRNTTGPRS